MKVLKGEIHIVLTMGDLIEWIENKIVDDLEYELCAIGYTNNSNFELIDMKLINNKTELRITIEEV